MTNSFDGWETDALERKAKVLRAQIENRTEQLRSVEQAIAGKVSIFKKGDVLLSVAGQYFLVHVVKLTDYRVTNPAAYKDYILGMYQVHRDGTVGRYVSQTIRFFD